MAKYQFTPSEAATTIATAISIANGKLGRPAISDSRIEIEPLREAGQFLVTVYEDDDFVTKVIPFMDRDRSPISITDPCEIGYKTNRKLFSMDLLQHGQLIGGTTCGKSSTIQLMLSHATRCPDCVIWIGGNWKLYDLVMGWVEPYLNTGIRPPIDWIAHGQNDVCDMLQAALNVGAYRSNRRITARTGVPKIIIVLNEVTYITNNRLIRKMVDGVPRTADEMICDNCRGVAGAGIHLWMDTQRDTQDMFGDSGGTTTAQLGFTFVFRIRDQGSIGRTINAWNVAIPTRRGECWLDPGPEDIPTKLQIPYAQTPDPEKPRLHNGPTLFDIAWSRRTIPHVLDDGSIHVAGEAYTNRHQLVTEDMIDYLHNARPTVIATSASPSQSSPTSPISITPNSTQAEVLAAEAQLNAMEAHLRSELGVMEGTVNAPTSSPPPSEESPIAELDDYRTLTEKVIRIIQVSKEPTNRAEIIETLEASGVEVKNPQVITNICNKYKKENPPKIAMTADDRYYAV